MKEKEAGKLDSEPSCRENKVDSNLGIRIDMEMEDEIDRNIQGETPAEVGEEILEKDDGGEKNGLSMKETGNDNTDEYFRGRDCTEKSISSKDSQKEKKKTQRCSQGSSVSLSMISFFCMKLGSMECKKTTKPDFREKKCLS